MDLAFWYDELLGTLMHPFRDQFPDDFVDYFRRRFRKHVDDSSHHVLVSTMYNDTGAEIITGHADWIRHRGGDDDVLVATTDPDVSLNRAADPAQSDIFERAGPFTKHYWTGNRADTWLLDLLAVHPEHQRKGYGKLLVMDGIKLAENDQVCASVIASAQGHLTYISCGFKPVGWVAEGEGNPLQRLPGGEILFLDRTTLRQPVSQVRVNLTSMEHS